MLVNKILSAPKREIQNPTATVGLQARAEWTLFITRSILPTQIKEKHNCAISKLLFESEMSYAIVQLCTYQWVLKAPTDVQKIQKDGKNDTTWPFQEL